MNIFDIKKEKFHDYSVKALNNCVKVFKQKGQIKISNLNKIARKLYSK